MQQTDPAFPGTQPESTPRVSTVASSQSLEQQRLVQPQEFDRLFPDAAPEGNRQYAGIPAQPLAAQCLPTTRHVVSRQLPLVASTSQLARWSTLMGLTRLAFTKNRLH